jgi:1-deoxy-D-xylulose-5-phosphate reductoisomerase
LNATNEVAVEAFLSGRISFPDIWLVNERIMQKSTFIAQPTLDDYIASDKEARFYALEKIGTLQLKH